MSAYTTVCYTEEERLGIQLQLDRLLLNAHFSNSRRFPSFLRFIIREELEGRGDQLKERTLGAEVFGRDPSYDTTSDPIVRVTAAEIRKRIAQYYQESGHDGELRISLPPGSYVPHFQWPQLDSVVLTPLPVADRTAAPPSIPSEPTAPRTASTNISFGSSRRWLVLSLVLLLSLAGGFVYQRTRPSALDVFWAPILNSGDSVAICFPQSHISGINLRDANEPGQLHQFTENINVVIVDDLRPLASLAGLLELHRQKYVLMGEDTASLTDLRQGPSIFVGAFDNAWTLRSTRNLRFKFGNDADMKHFWIEDTQSSTHVRWTIDRNQQEATNNYRDYAIVARFLDPNTGKQAVVAAGIARGGTVAAGEFLTQAANMEAFNAQAPKNWAGKNMEFVLSTEIIDGKSSPPKVEATYFW